MGLDAQRKFGPSRLGMSLAESRTAGMNERAIKNDILESKRVERLGRRAYRAALRGRDPSAYLQGLDALKEMRAVNGTTGAGIKMAGADLAGTEKHIAGTRAQIDAYNGKTIDSNGRLLPPSQSRILGDGSGTSPENAKGSSNGGEWVNVGGPGDSPGARTLEHRNWSGMRDGKLGDELAVQTNRPLSFSAGFMADTRQQFARDLSVSKLIEEGDKGALSRAVERGARLGLSRDQVLNYTGNNQQPELAGPPETAAASGVDGMLALARDLQSANRILREHQGKSNNELPQSTMELLREYRSKRNGEFLQSVINPVSESASSAIASRLLGGVVDAGNGFNPGPAPAESTPASRLVPQTPVANPATNSALVASPISPQPYPRGRLNVRFGDFTGDPKVKEELLRQKEAKAIRDAKNKAYRESRSKYTPLLTRLGMSKPEFLEGTLAGSLYDSINK